MNSKVVQSNSICTFCTLIGKLCLKMNEFWIEYWAKLFGKKCTIINMTQRTIKHVELTKVKPKLKFQTVHREGFYDLAKY